ncbi:MAG TPA: hypothetical protein VF631_05175 [Allosphingosinicella sp.]|jgi:hypothetical protein|uniref:hypothetical protein n=1 Tax=Allosphingosinicella sp. TaxID=2823234 RepID=UPI002F2754A3
MAGRDFSATVGALLASCCVPPALRRVTTAAEPTIGDRLSAALEAGAGDRSAMVRHAQHLYAAAQSSPDLDDAMLAGAEAWARRAVGAGSPEGQYVLADILLFRAGVALGWDDMAAACEFATESLGLLDQLADEGVEEAAAGIVVASAAMAANGLHLEGAAK